MATIQQFDFSVDLLQALLWQYNDAVNIQALLQDKQTWYDTNFTQFWSDWYNNVFDLPNANDFGCVVWAVILGIPISLVTPAQEDKPTFGFFNSIDNTFYHRNFYQSNFAQNASSGVTLTLAQKRLILQLRFYQLVARGTVPETNKILKTLFGDQGKVYILDALDMTAKCIFEFPINSSIGLVLTEYDLIPRPAGVKLTIVDGTIPTFGFGAFHKNFNNGVFTPYG